MISVELGIEQLNKDQMFLDEQYCRRVNGSISKISSRIWFLLSTQMYSIRNSPIHNLNIIFHESLLFIALFYAVFLVYSLLAPRHRLCSTIMLLDPGHRCRHDRIPRPKSCSSRASLLSSLDRYAAAHLVGWFVKAIVHPCRVTLWAASILFELAEYLLSRRIPFLSECWWDSMLLDVLLSNSIGMEVGLQLAKAVTAGRYRQRSAGSSFWNEAKIVVAMIATDLNFFILQEALQLRMGSTLHFSRVGFYILLALPASSSLMGGRKRFQSHVVAYYLLLVLEAAQLLWI